MGKRYLHFFSAVHDFILAGNDDIHLSLDEFEFGQIKPGFHGNR